MSEIQTWPDMKLAQMRKVSLMVMGLKNRKRYKSARDKEILADHTLRLRDIESEFTRRQSNGHEPDLEPRKEPRQKEPHPRLQGKIDRLEEEIAALKRERELLYEIVRRSQ